MPGPAGQVSGGHNSVIDHKSKKFIITDRPTDETIGPYVRQLMNANAVHLVRVCEPTYDTTPLEQAGIEVHDWPFEDGDPPPDDVIDRWLALDTEAFGSGKDGRIAVHCIAGLGRAPVMVRTCTRSLFPGCR